MKKIIRVAALLMAAVMLIALAACGAADTPAEESTGGVEVSGKTYVIASDTAFAPFEYLDTATGEYVGIDMDIVAAVAEDQGFSYEIQNLGFDAAMNAVQSEQADAIIAGCTITEERKQTFDFTDSYFDAGQILVVAADSDITSFEDLAGTTVAVKISTQGAEFAESIKDEYGFEVQTYEDSPTMYQAVMQGTNSGCFEDDPVARYSIQEQGLDLKVVGDVVNQKPYGVGAKKGVNTEFIDMFNAGIANIKANGVYDQILAKYGY